MSNIIFAYLFLSYEDYNFTQRDGKQSAAQLDFVVSSDRGIFPRQFRALHASPSTKRACILATTINNPISSTKGAIGV